MEKAWEKAIEAARGGQKTEETFVLTLDGALKCAPSRLPSAGLFEQFPFLQQLSLANSGLISLEGFPCLPHLRRLVLSDNRISGGLEHLVQAGLKSLQDLDLSNNRIGTFEDLVPLSQLRLGSLDLYECPVTRLPDYRARVFDVVKSLQFLDKADREGKERFDSEEEADSEEEDEEDVDNFNSEERANGSGVLNQEEVDFEDDEEDDELDVEEEDEYQDGVTINGHGAAAAAVGHVAANATTVNSSDEDDVEDEDDFQNVAEVQDLDGEDDDEDSDEIADDDGVAEDDEDGEGTEQASGAPGELDVQEVDDNAEDEDGELGDEDDDDEGVDNDARADGEDEEEDYGTEYLTQSIGKPEDEDGGSDFEPAGDAPEDEDIDEDGDDNHIAAGQKRSRDEIDSDSDDDDRNPKRR